VVLLGPLVAFSMVWSVRREIAPDEDRLSMANFRFSEAVSSPWARMMVARRSRSASACLAITRFILSGTATS